MTDDLALVKADELGRVAAAIFEKLGLPAEDAGWVAETLVRAELAGTSSHGTIRIPDYAARLDQVDGLRALVKKKLKPGTPAETASTMEFVLEALHQNSLVGKDQLSDEATTYNDIMGSMLSALGPLDDDDDLDEDDFYRRYQ